MAHYDDAIKHLDILGKEADFPQHLTVYRDKLIAEVYLRLSQDTNDVGERVAHLAKSLFLLNSLRENNSLMIERLYADGLIQLLRLT